MSDTIILNGKELAQELNQSLAETIRNSGVTPLLAVITVGENPASQIYVRNKRKAAQEVGIQTQEYHLGADAKQETVVALIKELNESEKADSVRDLQEKYDATPDASVEDELAALKASMGK